MVLSIILFIADYDLYNRSQLVWTMPLTGLLQTVIAVLTFTFLKKGTTEQGYYGDKYTMTYEFICENLFYSGLLLFQAMYYDPYFYEMLKMMVIPEIVMVFLPYMVIRPFVPKTSFRTSIYNLKDKTEGNREFYYYSIIVTKTFYIFAKHFLGHYYNYVRYDDRMSEDQVYWIKLMNIFAGLATTVSIFLHTLKFKKYIGPRASMLGYIASYMATFYAVFKTLPTIIGTGDIVLLTLGGIAINFLSYRYQFSYQSLLLLWFLGNRYNLI